MSENATDVSDDLRHSKEEAEHQIQELSQLFGVDTVEQARQIDVADLNMNDKMIATISDGVRKLKGLRMDPGAQRHLISGMEPGARLVLCLWIMDMGLLQKIRGQQDYITDDDAG
jgi:hypothetical protein